MASFFGIHWAGIDRLIYAPLALIFIILLVRNYLRIRAAARILAHPQTAGLVFKNFSLVKQLVKTILLSLSIVLFFIALLQPQWGKKDQKVVQEGRDLILLLDISRSMLATDMKPNRLDFAKLKIRNLLSKLTFERVGLVLFSGSAFLQCPLTADHAAFLMFLDQVDTETISSGTTSIGLALGRAIEVFAESPERKNKLVLLITDGEDYSLDLDAAQRQALEQSVKLLALGIGTTEGAPVPILNQRGVQIGHEKDASGGVVLTKLNEQLIKEMSTKLNGYYVRARYDDGDLRGLVNFIHRFEKEMISDKKISMYEDQYPWLLGLAWILLTIEWIL